MSVASDREYGRPHRKVRERLTPIVLAGRVRCARCGDPILPGEPWDLGHVDGDRSRYSGPEHRACNRATTVGGRGCRRVVPDEPETSSSGRASRRTIRGGGCRGCGGCGRRRPTRCGRGYMTVPHPRAAGSLGREFIRLAEERTGKPLRWWQRLVATRLLEVDEDERLVWETMVLTMARQLGKSWLLRELCLWRIHQGDRFGEPQDVLHTGKDLAVCKEVQRPAQVVGEGAAGLYKVREVNGQEEIELLDDGSRWMLRAKEAVYGYAVSLRRRG